MSGDKRYLRNCEVGETFTGFCVVRKRELRSRRDGEPFLALEFGDRSGRLSGNIWDNAEQGFQEYKEGDVVKLQGVIEVYRDARQIAIRKIRRSKPEDNVDPADLIPTSDLEPEEARRRLLRVIGSIRNPHLKALLDALFGDEQFLAGFLRAPGGKLWHHNRIGGLAEHTLALARLCRILSALYPEADRDLLVSGALLHDIGKIEEYRYETHIDYSDRGRLVGHITIGAGWVADRTGQLPDFPYDLRDKLLHLILSHQGEHGSPILPATREAFLLHYADEIDSKMDAFKRIAADQPDGERWRWVNLLERHLDFGSEREAEK